MCNPCCNEPPLRLKVETDNDCKCNCTSSCFSFFRRKSAEPPTPEQIIALNALAQRNNDGTQKIIHKKRVRKIKHPHRSEGANQ